MCRNGPVKVLEQDRDENTKLLPYYREMAEKKEIDYCYVFSIAHYILLIAYTPDVQ